jgi:hypothetical protein
MDIYTSKRGRARLNITLFLLFQQGGPLSRISGQEPLLILSTGHTVYLHALWNLPVVLDKLVLSIIPPHFLSQ